MKKEIKMGTLAGALLLSGCNLQIDIVGQGTVSDAEQTIVCPEDCSRRSIGSHKNAVLRAEAAPGYEFFGFIEDVRSGLGSFVYHRPTTVDAYYGYALMFVTDTEPYRWIAINTRATAIFLPEGSVAQSQNSSGSLCVLNQDQSLQCWGKAQKAAAAVAGVVTGLVAEIGVDEERNQWCVLTDAALQCLNEDTGQSWQIPQTISVPTSAALVKDVACVVHQGSGVPSLACLREDGSLVEGAPDIANPERVWVNESRQFCVENSDGAQCWSAT
jgi:hypothetical protein